MRVDTLVCETWLGLLQDGVTPAHINGDMRDSRLSNLSLARVRTAPERVVEEPVAASRPARRSGLTQAQREDAARRIKAGERVRSVARDFGMTDCGLANNLRLAGLLDMPVPRRPTQIMDDTRAAIRAERERGDRVVDIARRHAVSIGMVTKFAGAGRRNRESIVGERRRELYEAALRLTPKELMALFGLPRSTAYYHHHKARHDAQAEAAKND